MKMCTQTKNYYKQPLIVLGWRTPGLASKLHRQTSLLPVVVTSNAMRCLWNAASSFSRLKSLALVFSSF